MKGDMFYYPPYTLQGMFAQETATAVTDDTESSESTHPRTLSLQPRGLVATVLRAIPRIQCTHQLQDTATRSAHILTTRGTVGDHTCVERRKTLDRCDHCQHMLPVKARLAVLILTTLTSRDNWRQQTVHHQHK